MSIARVERLLAAALCALAAAGAQAVELGTLFHTQEERARLDRLRRGEPLVPVERAAGAAERRGELTGFVKRSDGRATVWIDGVPMAVSPKAAPLLDPKAVRGYAERNDENLKIERRPAR